MYGSKPAVNLLRSIVLTHICLLVVFSPPACSLRVALTYEPRVGEEAGPKVPLLASTGGRFRGFAVVLKLRQAGPVEAPATGLAQIPAVLLCKTLLAEFVV